ncbi:MAG: phosphotransferase [Myxococcales bacterium]|nr:phosphotransferase [Myxococcales bacterium]
MPILPTFADERARYLARADASLWAPAAAEIAARHRIPGPLEPTARGSNVVLLGPAHAIKLVTPRYARDLEAERISLELAEGRLPVATPIVVAAGELEGWPYLVLSLLGGEPAATIWDELDHATQARLIGELGELAAALHALPLPDPAPEVLALDWPAYMGERRAAALDKHRARGLDEAWIAEIAAFLDQLPPTSEWPAELVLLHNDLQLEHIHVDRSGERPRLCGLLDFADAQIGAREVDFVAVGGLVAPAFPAAASTFLRGYGLPASALTPELARRLTAHVLVHRYCDIAPLLRRYSEDTRPRDLGELIRRMWDFAAE